MTSSPLVKNGEDEDELQKKINEEGGVDFAGLEGSGNEVVIPVCDTKKLAGALLARNSDGRLQFRAVAASGKKAAVIQNLLQYMHEDATKDGNKWGVDELTKFLDKLK